MSRFRFPLAALLRLREQHRELCERRLAGAVQQLNAGRGQLQAIQSEEGAAISQMHESSHGPVQGHMLRTLHRYVAGMHAQRRAGQQRIAALEAGMEAQRRELADAHRRQRVLEKLKEAAWARHRTEQDRAAQRELDEIANDRAARAAQTEDPCTD